MKNSFIFILLFAFSARPLFYVGQYSYYAANIDYIIENYCINKDRPQLNCDGKCFLAKQMQLGKDKVENDALQQVVSAFFPVFQIQDVDYLITNHIVPRIAKESSHYVNSYDYLGVYFSLRPPAV